MYVLYRNDKVDEFWKKIAKYIDISTFEKLSENRKYVCQFALNGV